MTTQQVIQEKVMVVFLDDSGIDFDAISKTQWRYY